MYYNELTFIYLRYIHSDKLLEKIQVSNKLVQLLTNSSLYEIKLVKHIAAAQLVINHFIKLLYEQNPHQLLRG